MCVKISMKMLILVFFFLLRYNGHTTLYKRKVYKAFI